MCVQLLGYDAHTHCRDTELMRAEHCMVSCECSLLLVHALIGQRLVPEKTFDGTSVSRVCRGRAGGLHRHVYKEDDQQSRAHQYINELVL